MAEEPPRPRPETAPARLLPPRPREALPRLSPPRLVPPRLAPSRPPKERWLRVAADRPRVLDPPRLAVLRLARLRVEVLREPVPRVAVLRPEVVRFPKRLRRFERLSPLGDAPVLVRVRWEVVPRVVVPRLVPRRVVVPRVVVPRVVVPRVVVPREVPLREEDQLRRRLSAAWLRAESPALRVRDVVERVDERDEDRFTPEGAAKRERLLEPRLVVDREGEELRE